MKPPICHICGKRMEDIDDGGLIYFKKRSSDMEWEEKMKKIGGVGHPPWAEWFCAKHYDRAKELSHLTISEVMKEF
jgi:hypothetical protein